jgi:hypothetical protein
MRFTRLLLVLPFTLWLTGCPVWGDDGGPGPSICVRNSDCPMARPECVLGQCVEPCDFSDQCRSGYVCDSGGCFPGECATDRPCPNASDICEDRACVENPCRNGNDCPSGQRCEDDICVPGPTCNDDDDCTTTGEICDDRDTCVPLPPGECRNTDDCTGTEVCVDGECIDPGNEGCQFDYECNGGVCVNNACRPVCDGNEDCGSGSACDDGICQPVDECTTSAQCDVGEHCRYGRCHPGCNGQAHCTLPDVCFDGFCRPDPTPRPFCTVATQSVDCAPGSVCVNGACRVSCTTPDTSSSECMMEDVSFIECSTGLICLTAIEVAPECLTVEDCTGTESCVNGECRTL